MEEASIVAPFGMGLVESQETISKVKGVLKRQFKYRPYFQNA